MNLPIDEVKKLYFEEGLSAKIVGERLGASVWQVIKFMKKNNLARRKAAETISLAFWKIAPTFEARGDLTEVERELKIAGLMLYWGEGTKYRDQIVDLANSDPVMIKIFLQMLRTVYGILEEKLRVLIYCYSDQDVNKLKEYWMKITNISEKQFIKPYIRQDFLEKKKNKMPNGLIHIRYHDKKLYNLMKNDTDEIVKSFSMPG
ncbi:MAG: hypothetical protein UV73_C0013G0030 [Candidatus Gottesmanbacteria bacterium GW2011_GWA2_43_14]|uniref:Uncharacterized protein n=1 Tax=Candidatus Gottesmanbacteria bacterium GW2011_GWA2_43_14 TaxID=1618443 RepID=A0A0G1DDC3_9BACT|nr:MAG: hypothetical protein UV73_C0013G0030 [Candidatus Gottesmanbacteria bacterium GW2011_GWA2_43_14]